MSYPNRAGQAGTVAALRASNPMLPPGVGALIGPDAGAVEGTLDQPGTGPGAELDARLDDLDGRVTALETGGAA